MNYCYFNIRDFIAGLVHHDEGVLRLLTDKVHNIPTIDRSGDMQQVSWRDIRQAI